MYDLLQAPQQRRWRLNPKLASRAAGRKPYSATVDRRVLIGPLNQGPKVWTPLELDHEHERCGEQRKAVSHLGNMLQPSRALLHAYRRRTEIGPWK